MEFHPLPKPIAGSRSKPDRSHERKDAPNLNLIRIAATEGFNQIAHQNRLETHKPDAACGKNRQTKAAPAEAPPK
jgi:hypothetical protein